MSATDTPTLDLGDGFWLSMSDLAERKGVSRQAIAKRVGSLADAGKVETRPGPNGTKLVNLAQYDRAVGETGDAFKEMAAETKHGADDGDAGGNSFLRDQQARGAQYSADLKKLDLDQRLGELVPVADVTAAAERAAEAIVRVVDRLPTYAEAIAAGVGKDGANGARITLKDIAREMRQGIAEAMAALAVPKASEPVADAEPV